MACSPTGRTSEHILFSLCIISLASHRPAPLSYSRGLHAVRPLLRHWMMTRPHRRLHRHASCHHCACVSARPQSACPCTPHAVVSAGQQQHAVAVARGLHRRPQRAEAPPSPHCMRNMSDTCMDTEEACLAAVVVRQHQHEDGCVACTDMYACWVMLPQIRL